MRACALTDNAIVFYRGAAGYLLNSTSHHKVLYTLSAHAHVYVTYITSVIIINEVVKPDVLTLIWGKLEAFSLSVHTYGMLCKAFIV